MQTDDGLVNLIAACLRRTFSHGMSDYVTKLNWRINLKELEEFIPIEETATRVRTFSAMPQFDELDADKKMAIQVFLDTVDGKIKGLSLRQGNLEGGILLCKPKHPPLSIPMTTFLKRDKFGREWAILMGRYRTGRFFGGNEGD